MDPNATLKELLTKASELRGIIEDPMDLFPEEIADRGGLELAKQILENLNDLDGWLVKGGFLPERWVILKDDQSFLANSHRLDEVIDDFCEEVHTSAELPHRKYIKDVVSSMRVRAAILEDIAARVAGGRTQKTPPPEDEPSLGPMGEHGGFHEP